MKILTAMYTLRRGGAYDRFLMMLEAFLERDCEIHCLSMSPIQIKHSLFHNHIIYFQFKKMDGLIPKLVVLFIFPPWAIWIVWRNKIDFIIAFGSLYAFILGFSKCFLKRPMVTLIRGSLPFGFGMQNSPQYQLYPIKRIQNIGFCFSDRIITNNLGSRSEILKKFGKRKNINVQVLYNNIPPMDIQKPEDTLTTRERYGVPKGAKALVTAGILNRGKNIEILIECLPKVEAKDIYLLIVGDGFNYTNLRYKEYLQGLARRLKVDKKVIFTGWIGKAELWGIFFASDLFILPSINEGMPNALLEALGCDIPCLGSDIHGIREVLHYDELMFNPFDVKALVNKVQQAIDEGSFFERIKELCRERKTLFMFDWKERLFQIATG